MGRQPVIFDCCVGTRNIMAAACRTWLWDVRPLIRLPRSHLSGGTLDLTDSELTPRPIRGRYTRGTMTTHIDGDDSHRAVASWQLGINCLNTAKRCFRYSMRN